MHVGGPEKEKRKTMDYLYETNTGFVLYGTIIVRIWTSPNAQDLHCIYGKVI